MVTIPETTFPVTVLPPLTSADPHATSSNRVPLAHARTNLERPTALVGTVSPVVSKASHANMVSIGAPFVVPSPTMPNNVPLSNNFLFVHTPFVPNKWENMLKSTSSFNRFHDVPTGIRFGFDMGVNSLPTCTYTLPNHNSAIAFPEHILSHIHNKLSSRHYTGPFSRSRLEYLIGPFRSSPLGTIPKPGTSERRTVQDLSFPHNDPSHASINDEINIDDFRCDWGTFNDVQNIVVNAPLGTEAATLDVDSAFRHCPILPAQQPNFIICWDNLYYIDHNAPFGASSTGSVFGKLADALSTILASRNIGPSKNQVDNFVFFRFPSFASTGLYPFPTPYLTSLLSLTSWVGLGRTPKPNPFRTSSNTWASSGIFRQKLCRSQIPKVPLPFQAGTLGCWPKVLKDRHRISSRHPRSLFSCIT